MLMIILGLLAVSALILAACGPSAPDQEVIVETVVVEKEGQIKTETIVETVVVEVEATPEPVTHKGGWLDTIIIVEEPSSDSAVTRLNAGDIDVYAYNIAEPDIAQRVFESETLVYQTAYGNFNDIRFMLSTTKEIADGRLNPFFSDRIREAMNWP